MIKYITLFTLLLANILIAEVTYVQFKKIEFDEPALTGSEIKVIFENNSNAYEDTLEVFLQKAGSNKQYGSVSLKPDIWVDSLDLNIPGDCYGEKCVVSISYNDSILATSDTFAIEGGGLKGNIIPNGNFLDAIPIEDIEIWDSTIAVNQENGVLSFSKSSGKSGEFSDVKIVLRDIPLKSNTVYKLTLVYSVDYPSYNYVRADLKASEWLTGGDFRTFGWGKTARRTSHVGTDKNITDHTELTLEVGNFRDYIHIYDISLVPEKEKAIVITKPIYADTFTLGVPNEIRWIYSGDIPFVDIHESTDNGKAFYCKGYKRENKGVHWYTPNTESDFAFIRVESTDGDAREGYEGQFFIKAKTAISNTKYSTQVPKDRSTINLFTLQGRMVGSKIAPNMLTRDNFSQGQYIIQYENRSDKHTTFEKILIH